MTPKLVVSPLAYVEVDIFSVPLIVTAQSLAKDPWKLFTVALLVTVTTPWQVP